MTTSLHSKSSFVDSYKIEIAIQIGIAILFFFVRAMSRNHHEFSWIGLPFMTNYLITGLVINYVLIPRFYNVQKYWQFAVTTFLTIIVAIMVHELVLEKIFYPETRGVGFSSVTWNFARMLPMIFLFVGFKFAWDAQTKNKEIDQLRNVVVESQLQFLKSQINPHFLFNSLNNLYAYALEKSEKTPQIILELSSLLRYMLYECREETVPLEKEVKYLDDFVKLQSLQIEERGDVNFSSSGNFADKKIAPLILIVFLENCFKHSTSSQSDKIKIDIQVNLEDTILKVKCKNSYSENQNTDNLTKGIGLSNVISRLDLLYPQKYTLDINPEDELYRVNLEIDLS